MSSVRPNRAPLPFLIPAIFVGLGVLVPLGYLVLRAFQANPSELGSIVFRSQNLSLLGNTLLLVVGVLLFSTILAVPMAWITTKTDLPFKTFWTVALTLPMAIPGYVGVFGFLGATGSQGWLSHFIGIDFPKPSGYWGAVGTLGFFIYPYLFLNTRAALLGLDQSLEESAQGLGYPPMEIFLKVILPQLRPALVSSWLLIGLHVLGDFGVVSLMGYETFSYAIYRQYAGSFDRLYAAWLALLVLGLTGSMLWLEWRLMSNLWLNRVGQGSARKIKHAPLGKVLPLAVLGLSIPVFAALVVPMVSIFYWSFFGKSNLGLGELWFSFSNTLRASVPPALLATILATPLAYLGVRFPGRLSKILERTAYLGYATPPVAFGLSLIFFSLRGVSGLYQTLTLLILAFTFHFLAEAIGPIRSALYQAPPRLEEAARSLGYSPTMAFFRVTVPLLRPGLLASMALIFISCAKELPLTFLLAPLGFKTLATQVWSYTSEALFSPAAPFAFLIVILSAGFISIILRGEAK